MRHSGLLSFFVLCAVVYGSEAFFLKGNKQVNVKVNAKPRAGFGAILGKIVEFKINGLTNLRSRLNKKSAQKSAPIKKSPKHSGGSFKGGFSLSSIGSLFGGFLGGSNKSKAAKTEPKVNFDSFEGEKVSPGDSFSDGTRKKRAALDNLGRSFSEPSERLESTGDSRGSNSFGDNF